MNSPGATATEQADDHDCSHHEAIPAPTAIISTAAWRRLRSSTSANSSVAA